MARGAMRPEPLALRVPYQANLAADLAAGADDQDFHQRENPMRALGVSSGNLRIQ